MKTPKEKAKEMVDIIYKILLSNDHFESYQTATKLALQIVDEICEAINWHDFETPNKEWKYWNEVKVEIKKL